MNEPNQSPDDLNSFEKHLGLFVAQSKMDRDAVMFAAGQNSVGTTPVATGRERSGVRYWQVATAAMTMLSASLGGLIVLRPVPEPRVVIVERVLRSGSESPARGASDSAERQDETTGEGTTVAEDVAVHPDLMSSRESDDEFASAWKARQALITESGKVEFQSDDAAAANRRTAWGGDVRLLVDQPLTGASLLPGRSRDAVSRSLEERL